MVDESSRRNSLNQTARRSLDSGDQGSVLSIEDNFPQAHYYGTRVRAPISEPPPVQEFLYAEALVIPPPRELEGSRVKEEPSSCTTMMTPAPNSSFADNMVAYFTNLLAPPPAQDSGCSDGVERFSHKKTHYGSLTKKNIRWILQAIMITLLGSLIVLIRPIDQHVFRGSGYYVVFSGLAVLESNTGSCFRKSFGRFFGTILGGFFGGVIFIIISWNEFFLNAYWFPYLLLLTCILFLIPWGMLRLRHPHLHYLSQYAAATGLMILHLGYFRKGGVLEIAITRTSAVATGVLLNAIVVLLILPNPVRPSLTRGLALILRALKELIEPAIDFSSGYSSCQGFAIPIDNLSQINNSNLPSTSKLLTNSHEKLEPISRYVKWGDMVRELQTCHSLLIAEKELMEAAINEVQFRRPWVLNRAKTVAAYEEMRHLFFHIASLVYSIEVQLAKQRPIEITSVTKKIRLRDRLKLRGIFTDNNNNDDNIIMTTTNTNSDYQIKSTTAECGAVTAEGRAAAAAEEDCSLSEKNLDLFLSGLPPFLHVYFSKVSSTYALTLGFNILHTWAQTYGPLQQKLMVNVSTALESMADFLTHSTDAQLQETRWKLETAVSSATAFREMRLSRSRQFAEAVGLSSTSQKMADLEEFWGLGLDKMMQFLNASERQAVWDLHTAMRDQLCLVDQTLTALCDQLVHCLDSFIDLCQEEVAKNRRKKKCICIREKISTVELV